jgi:hypothetical protein
MQTREILALANYVWRNYPEIRNKVNFWQILSLLDRNQDKIIFIKDGDGYAGCAFYLRLSDENLLGIIRGDVDLKEPRHLEYLLKDNGENIHFIYCVAGGMRAILKGLKKMIKHENPLSVSWFKPDMKDIHMVQFKKRSDICLQQS